METNKACLMQLNLTWTWTVIKRKFVQRLFTHYYLSGQISSIAPSVLRGRELRVFCFKNRSNIILFKKPRIVLIMSTALCSSSLVW